MCRFRSAECGAGSPIEKSAVGNLQSTVSPLGRRASVSAEAATRQVHLLRCYDAMRATFRCLPAAGRLTRLSGFGWCSGAEVARYLGATTSCISRHVVTGELSEIPESIVDSWAK